VWALAVLPRRPVADLAVGFVLVLCALAIAAAARADDRGVDSPAHPHAAPAAGAPFRWSDGPRNVPRPRGAAAERARSLGLGTREAATHLLSHAPEARWVAAARGRKTRSLRWPVDGARLGRGFGFVRRERTELPHRGLDVAGAPGQPVRAVADGIVAYSDNGIRGYGNCVILVHPDGLVSLYAHLERATVQAGWRVTRGERIGFVGATGIARGPHLHFELREQGRPIDPESRFAAIPGRKTRAPRAPSRGVGSIAGVGSVSRLQRVCGRGSTSPACSPPGSRRPSGRAGER
jgi:murein DD-endopeptidase MepM/ murein hydrolase activator NlpD